MRAGDDEDADAAAVVARVSRSEWGRIVAALIRLTGDWTLAEDATQEAFAVALVRWPRDGVPDKPGAWLQTVARNRAIDRLRSAATEKSRLREVAIMRSFEQGDDDADDRLRLVFTCCHPALALPSRVALTLRTVAGLSVPEIAAAFLVPETTMGQRLVRARRKIEQAGIPYRVPPPELLAERLGGVLAVVYLVFNQGYSYVARNELTSSAVELASALVDLMPREPEARGLLALLLLQNSRRDARIGAEGQLLTLEEQDRGRWHAAEISRGLALLPPTEGPYALQAAIAACHARALSADDTDWASIVRLYDRLLEVAPSPVTELARAIAIGMREGPAAGLRTLRTLKLDGYRWLPAAEADLLVRAGRLDEAADRFRQAVALTPEGAERADLERRLAALRP